MSNVDCVHKVCIRQIIFFIYPRIDEIIKIRYNDFVLTARTYVKENIPTEKTKTSSCSRISYTNANARRTKRGKATRAKRAQALDRCPKKTLKTPGLCLNQSTA